MTDTAAPRFTDDDFRRIENNLLNLAEFNEGFIEAADACKQAAADLDHITALEAKNERLKRDCGIWERTAKVRTEGLVGAEAELARIKGRLTDGKIAMLVADRIGYPCDQATPPCLGMCHCSNTARDIIEHITEEPKP